MPIIGHGFPIYRTSKSDGPATIHTDLDQHVEKRGTRRYALPWNRHLDDSSLNALFSTTPPPPDSPGDQEEGRISRDDPSTS